MCSKSFFLLLFPEYLARSGDRTVCLLFVAGGLNKVTVLNKASVMVLIFLALLLLTVMSNQTCCPAIQFGRGSLMLT